MTKCDVYPWDTRVDSFDTETNPAVFLAEYLESGGEPVHPG